MRLLLRGVAVFFFMSQFCAGTAAAAESDVDRQKMLESIDRVIADPRDHMARSSLAKQAGQAVEEDLRAREEERDELMRAAKAREEWHKSLSKRKKNRFSSWKKDFSAACSLASDSARIAEAVAAYEKSLEAFPVYLEKPDLLRSSSEKIRGIFLKTIRKNYPYLAEGEAGLTDRMLAAAYFSEAYREQELFGVGQQSDAMGSHLRKAARLRELEAALRSRQEDLSKGVYLYKRGDFEASSGLLKKVLVSDRTNEDALYYNRLISDRLSDIGSQTGD